VLVDGIRSRLSRTGELWRLIGLGMPPVDPTSGFPKWAGFLGGTLVGRDLTAADGATLKADPLHASQLSKPWYDRLALWLVNRFDRKVNGFVP